MTCQTAGSIPRTRRAAGAEPAGGDAADGGGEEQSEFERRWSLLRGLRAGVLVQCEGGYYTGRNGGWVYDNRGKRIRGFPGDGGDGHLANFIAAMHSRRSGDLAAILTNLRAGDILFIDEIHTLVGAGGGGEGAMDAANILKPALAKGDLRAIGADDDVGPGSAAR